MSWLVSVLRPATFVELGTHNGYSYFSVCETLARLGIECSAHAVDTWEGDDQAGFYGEGVYPAVVSINEAEFAGFSTLHRATFDEALADIEDGTVDLLHIDGRHGYEDVSHDYRSWVPKLSGRAVVIFHDVAERREGFGVWRFWDEISSTVPSFRFDHNHGLGVLGVWPDLDPAIAEFFAAGAVSGEDIRAFYAELGSKITAEYAAGLAAAAELHEARARAIAAEELAAAREAELIGVGNQLDAIHASSSWRITAPLRTVGGWFRRGR
ncbi:class I SAM-dependent methyltransferase [Agromyces bauzanensis]|uniref:class I SAM-dependent methyltransferase n=1 Tax=Agromyces bauzanensis TaxID=1308924 RepID=UPI00166DB325|nr:class I SAM-dependent methyltransferase [Agromyces bauzanensis]